MKGLTFNSQIIKEGEMYVAYCPELDVSSCGYEVEEAKGNSREAVRLFLEETYRMGTLYDILIAAGYRVEKKTY
ncbi:MAG: hypothetical protein QXQ02_08305 [Halobacteria archaeon]